MAADHELSPEALIRRPVTSEQQAAAIRDGKMDAQSDTLRQLELRKIAGRLKRTGHGADTLVGLALSGGGIRSATFNLGVLQALASRGWLKRVDYLSTVSGGGYIGSALTWWCSGRADPDGSVRFGDGPDDFPYGTGSHNPRLKHLREHGNWLTPGDGIDLFAGLAVVLRGLLVNFAIWIPILAAVMFAMYFRIGLLSPLDLPGLTDWGALFDLLGVPIRTDQPDLNVYELLFWLSVLVILLYGLLGCLVYSIATGFGRGSKGGKMSALRPSRYRMRRFTERWAGFALKFIAASLVFFCMPVVIYKLHAYLHVVGPGAALGGLLSTAWVHSRTSNEGKGKVPFGLLVTVAAGLLIFAILLLAQGIAYWARCTWTQDFTAFCTLWAERRPPKTYLWWFAGAVGAATVLGIWVNLNYMSLHRFYRDRLMEAFMPSLVDADAGRTAPALLADRARLSEMWNDERPSAPFHLINANVVLVNSAQRKYRMRGGDSFLLSPLYCGSNSTGWDATDRFVRDRISLASAMAISGAAANPNTGTGDVSLTRNRLVSLLMALANVQLGYWVPAPGARKFATPTHFLPGLYNVTGWFLGKGFTEKSWFLQLSDGGHFDNLGLYELIRRRMRLIVLCDAGADPAFAFGDLENAVTRIREDFGVELHFREPSSPHAASAHPVSALVAGEKPAFPKAEHLACCGHVLADICYPGVSWKGLLVMMKTTLIPDLPVEVLSYKATHPTFPDQTTADQFFNESQFEAYRLLGVAIASAMMDNPHVQSAVNKQYGDGHFPQQAVSPRSAQPE